MKTQFLMARTISTLALSLVVSGAIALPSHAGNAPAGGTSSGSSFGIPFGSGSGSSGQTALSPDAQNAVNDAANLLISQLGGNQPLALGTGTGGQPTVTISSATRTSLQQLLLGQTATGDGGGNSIQTALEGLDGVNTTAVQGLVDALNGLLAGGNVNATQLQAAINSYNALVDSLSPAALASLSTEAGSAQQALVAVQYALGSLSEAAAIAEEDSNEEEDTADASVSTQ